MSLALENISYMKLLSVIKILRLIIENKKKVSTKKITKVLNLTTHFFNCGAINTARHSYIKC